jgi:hypothetical protein
MKVSRSFSILVQPSNLIVNKGIISLSTPYHCPWRANMKIQYNKNSIIAAARFILENNPSSKIVSEIPHTNRGFLAERGYVDDILDNIRVLAKDNAKVFEEVQQALAAGETEVDHLWKKWVEVLGVGGYWIIADLEGSTINFAVAVTPWFGEYICTSEEI